MSRIISIGDLHGDFKTFTEILEMNKLIDENNKWIGGSTYVVQLGDTLDGKRPDVILDSEFLHSAEEYNLFNYIIELDKEAKQSGGRVISILGNHELYPYYLKGDKTFNDEYVKEVDKQEYIKKFEVKRWMYYYPGYPGAKLLAETRPLLLQVGEFLFIHGSPTPEFIKHTQKNGKISIKNVNNDVANWLKGSTKVPKYLNEMTNVNPLFNRDFSIKKHLSPQTCKKLLGYLSYFPGVKYIVMGHTVYKNINSTCRNRLFRTDLALSRAFGGNLKTNRDKYQVLEIIQHPNQDPKVNVLSVNNKTKLL